MRLRIAQEHKGRSIWDIKHRRGGLVDIEFLAQYLMLRHGAEHPDILSQNTSDALSRLTAAGLLAQTGSRGNSGYAGTVAAAARRIATFRRRCI